MLLQLQMIWIFNPTDNKFHEFFLQTTNAYPLGKCFQDLKKLPFVFVLYCPINDLWKNKYNNLDESLGAVDLIIIRTGDVVQSSMRSGAGKLVPMVAAPM